MTKLDHSRVGTIFFIFIFFFAIAIFNLYIVQVKQTIFFSQLGQQQYNLTQKAYPSRAEIYDRNGQLLALNKKSYAAFLIPKKMERPDKVQAFLEQYFPDAAERLKKHKTSNFFYIKRRLTKEEKKIIETNNITDIKLLTEARRFYPIPSLGSVLGFTDIDNNGLSGIEYLYNNLLTGEPSVYTLEKDARSGYFYFKKEMKKQGKNGNLLMVTLDSTLQFLVYEKLKEHILAQEAEEGSVLIMDPDTGEILAMVNYPGFNPNKIFGERDIPLTKNKIATETYELGSVIKAFFALAALAEKVVTENELIDCLSTKTAFIDGVKIGTTQEHSLLTFGQVIALSNNIGCALVAQRLGTRLYEHYKKIGFSKKTTLNFPGEQSGILIPPEHWSKSTLFTLSYGYSISATLLQLARAFSVIANGGYLVEPILLKEKKTSKAKKNEPLYDSNTLRQIRDILAKTIIEGSARFAHVPGCTVLCKTGTANLLTNGVYDKTHNIFTLAAIIEKNEYRRVVINFIKGKGKHNLYASKVAVPLFEAVAHIMLIHDGVLGNYLQPQNKHPENSQ